MENCQLCLICKKIIQQNNLIQKYLLCDTLQQNNETQLEDALKLLTNAEIDIPHKDKTYICADCFNNTDAALTFQYLCSKALNNAMEQLKEVIIKTDEDLLECLLCNRSLDEDKRISIHKQLPYISSALTQWDVLSLLFNFDQLDENNIKQYSCYICFYNTVAYAQFINLCNRSKKKMNEENQELLEGNVCRFCQLAFKNKAHLRNHLVKCHQKEAEEINPNINKRKCEYCNKYFYYHYYPIHILTHTGPIPYECELCGQKFRTHSTLKLHLATHSEDRPFLCTICGCTFQLQNFLDCHMSLHADQPKSTC